jgi:ubiquinone/menaquinone biosynthesis C-methylase UbiE
MFGTGFYDLFMRPLERSGIRDLRRLIMPEAAGKVLELGAGTGANLDFYDYSRITDLTLSDMRTGILLSQRAAKRQAHVIEADVEHLPFEDAFFDTVVFTLLFCSVRTPEKGLKEIRRVLRPGGRILFLEHVLSCSSAVRGLQHVLTPLWRLVSGNCHLNRDTVTVIEACGFSVERTERRAGCVLTAGIARR